MKNQFSIKSLATEYVFWVLALMGVRIISNVISALVGYRDLDFTNNIIHGYRGCLVNAIIVTALSRSFQLLLRKKQVANKA